jgi:hypothetical protein
VKAENSQKYGPHNPENKIGKRRDQEGNQKFSDTNENGKTVY